jgi:hypothetical protein
VTQIFDYTVAVGEAPPLLFFFFWSKNNLLCRLKQVL